MMKAYLDRVKKGIIDSIAAGPAEGGYALVLLCALGIVLEDLLTACERTADHCSNVAVEMLQVSEGKLEAHEYLNALKAGKLHESAAFAERFARYKEQYALPEDN